MPFLPAFSAHLSHDTCRAEHLYASRTVFVLFLLALVLGPLAGPFPGYCRTGPPSPYAGKRISKITIVIGDIFPHDAQGWLYRTANSLKVNTREKVIKRELLFKEGQIWNDFVMAEAERRLRSLGYIRNVRFDPTIVNDEVEVTVYVQDTWTLIPQINYSSSGGKNSKSVGIKESNVAGYGKRLELSYTEDENRQIVETVYDDQQLFGSSLRLQTALFQRNDGDELVAYLGQPFRSLLDRTSWYTNTHLADTVGRLFKNGTEDYIFRQANDEISLRYTLSQGNPSRLLRRYSLGYDFRKDTFRQADSEDYQDLDLDPATVSNDPALLPANRRYSGPVLTYQYLKPDYISSNYIDRFDRVEDYNLGPQWDFSVMAAPEALGSEHNTLLLSSTGGRGARFGQAHFLRGEVGSFSRLDEDGFQNSLFRGDARYYNVLGQLTVGGLDMGRHTLALSLVSDYGHDLDRDRQLQLGADNGLRGYKARAFNGDKLLLFNFEDRMHFIDDLYKLISVGAALFIDAGGATYDPYGTLFTDNLYADFGAGLRLAFPRSAGGLVVRIDCGIPMRSAADGTRGFEARLVFAGGQLFSSRLQSEAVGPEKANFSIGLADD